MSLAGQVLVSCEHASNRLPRGFELDADLLELHIAWDPGALPIAKNLARRFGATLHAGRYSRLVADLNRSVGNRVMFRRVSDGRTIPFNYRLDATTKAQRAERFYWPYRDAIDAEARRIIAAQGRCVHISVHTFTPTLDGKARGNDIGLLHDPRWGIEPAVCNDLRRYLTATSDWVVWFNRPYSGTADGILPAMRRKQTPETFVGIELEINQKHTDDAATLRAIAARIGEGFEGSPSLTR